MQMICFHFSILGISYCQIIICSNLSIDNMRGIHQSMTTTYIVLFVKQATKGANLDFCKRSKRNKRPSLIIPHRIPKHLNKSGFDEVVQLLKLLFPHGNQTADLVQYGGDFALLTNVQHRNLNSI